MQEQKSSNRLNTVDQREIAHFNKYVADDWWGKITPLHTLNKIRVPLIQYGLLGSSTEVFTTFGNNKILEVGCGGGILTEELAQHGGIVHGIDPSFELIGIAKWHASLNSKLSNLTYSFDTIEEHSLHNYEKYDIVVVSEVIEHITEKELFLETCVKCLKPGGSIFITTFNKTIWSWLISIMVVQEILNVIPRGVHSWKKFISPENVSKMLKKHNCKTVGVKGTSFNFVRNSWKWSSSVSTTYCLQAIKEN